MVVMVEQPLPALVSKKEPSLTCTFPCPAEEVIERIWWASGIQTGSLYHGCCGYSLVYNISHLKTEEEVIRTGERPGRHVLEEQLKALGLSDLEKRRLQRETSLLSTASC